jgi:uncharacterized protein (TIGR00730 family)
MPTIPGDGAAAPVQHDPRTVNVGSPNGRQEKRFLAGPQTRSNEFVSAARIFREFIRGFRALHFVGPCVTVFGSARFKEEHRYYELARQVGQELAKVGFTVMTGGGPGIMEAANRGAKDVGGRSVGANIDLNLKEPANRYLDKMVVFRQFFVRKVMLVKYSYAFVCMPGGVGTMDEIFEAVTLSRLMSTDYWGISGLMRSRCCRRDHRATDIDRLIDGRPCMRRTSSGTLRCSSGCGRRPCVRADPWRR